MNNSRHCSRRIVRSSKRLNKWWVTAGLRACLILSGGLLLYVNYKYRLNNDESEDSFVRRLEEDSSESYEDACRETDYPQDYIPIGRGWLTCSQLEDGGVTLLIIGIMYMFLALAIVCDEFFVPALEVMAEKWALSDDVAGATLMAAGGSAPELFTSFLGVFVAKSDVGFGTIVGSAVFNVLFVIGMCAIFSNEVLVLTWWPLARDSSYYTISLISLAVFFEYFKDSSVSSPKQILWWEALILFLMYIGYVILMMKNEKLYTRVQTFLNRNKKTTPEEVSEKSTSNNSQEAGSGFIQIQSPQTDEGIKETRKKSHSYPGALSALISDAELGDVGLQLDQIICDAPVNFDRPSKFRAGVLHLMISDKSMLETVGIHMVSNIQGDARETFQKVAALCIGENSTVDTMNRKEFSILLRSLNNNATTSEINEAFSTIDSDENGFINYEEFRDWYKTSETRLLNERKKAFDLIDSDHNGEIDREELQNVLVSLGIKFEQSDVDAAFDQLDLNNDGKISEDEFNEWYENSIFFRDRVRELSQMTLSEVGDEEDETAFNGFPSFPSGESISARLMYFVSLPLIVLLYGTIPNTTLHRLRCYYLIAFILSIAWIGIFSYFMVWWATITGDVIGIPPDIMGLTFLAAGTSVPDLLSSVIVAKQGKGDMAVSSSIGSNIFDVLVGLPVPWLIYTLANNEPQPVKSESLGISILVLLLMLVAVIGTIAFCHWRMTKRLGITMFVLYFVFLAQDLIRAAYT